jgi:peroxiredoxin
MAVETRRTKLSAGELLPLFRLGTVNRAEQLGPGDYKQRRNLALIFFGSTECQACRKLLREIAAHYGEYQQLEAEVLAVSADESTRVRRLAQELALPFPVLADSDGSVTDRYLEQKGAAAPAAAVFIADRWGAIFTRKIAAQEPELPAETELRGWLEFIELQCEECFPSEWPRTEK